MSDFLVVGGRSEAWLGIESSVGFGNVAQVLRALSVLDQVVDAVDPLNSDIGRLRVAHLAKKRAR